MGVPHQIFLNATQDELMGDRLEWPMNATQRDKDQRFMGSYYIKNAKNSYNACSVSERTQFRRKQHALQKFI